MKKNKKAAAVESVVEPVTNAQSAPEEVDADQAPVPTPFGLRDLQTLAEIVNLACRRGAFDAREAKTVGEVYERLNGFLAVSTAASDAQATAAAEAAAQNGDAE